MYIDWQKTRSAYSATQTVWSLHCSYWYLALPSKHQLQQQQKTFIFMPPTLKKLEGHIASGTFVHACVHLSVRVSVRYAFWCKGKVLKFHVWIPHEKIADTYFFFPRQDYAPFLSYEKIADTYFFFPVRIMPLSWVMALWRNMGGILSARYLKNYWS